jgi:hypothetical protein
MASKSGQVGELIGRNFVDKRRGNSNANSIQMGSALTTPANWTSTTSIETALLSNGYTNTQLQIMNLNDKVYALRLATEAGGI